VYPRVPVKSDDVMINSARVTTDGGRVLVGSTAQALKRR
jgi:hypothetical protein